MARMLSQVATIMRGSVGGLTYSANQFHQITIRARTAPVQPGTNRQQEIRNSLSAASLRWKDVLDASERAKWDNYAPTCVYSGPMGTYVVPGRSLYIAGRGLMENIFTNYGGIGALSDAEPSQPGFYARSGIEVGGATATGTGF